MNIEKLYPEYKSYIWGGERLALSYGKKTHIHPIAESRELSFHKDGLTRLSDGTALADALTPEVLGANVISLGAFPTLIKFIDAKADLSVQVHPLGRLRA